MPPGLYVPQLGPLTVQRGGDLSLPTYPSQTVSFAPSGSGQTFDATINAVDMANTYLYFPDYAFRSSWTLPNHKFRVALQSTTVVRASRSGTTSLSGDPAFKVYAVQLPTGIIKSIQRGTITLDSGTLSTSVTITSVDTAKVLINNLGESSNGTLAEFPYTSQADLTLTSSTQLTATKPDSGAIITVSYEVIEFY